MYSLEAQSWGDHMLYNSALFLWKKNLLINLNRRESPNLPGMAADVYVGFLRLTLSD